MLTQESPRITFIVGLPILMVFIEKKVWLAESPSAILDSVIIIWARWHSFIERPRPTFRRQSCMPQIKNWGESWTHVPHSNWCPDLTKHISKQKCIPASDSLRHFVTLGYFYEQWTKPYKLRESINIFTETTLNYQNHKLIPIFIVLNSLHSSVDSFFAIHITFSTTLALT